MRKIVKRLISVVSAAALLATTAVSALATSASAPHTHKGAGNPITDSVSDGYTITINRPSEGTPESGHIHYAAYQIFSGSVPAEDENGYPTDTGAYTNPGTNGTELPITDIKWGNAFGVPNTTTWQDNIAKFVYALGTMKDDKDYGYAFSMMTEFAGFINSSYVSGTAGGQLLANEFYKDGTAKTNENIKFDYLAQKVVDIVATKTDRKWLQAFTDILGGFAQGSDSSYLKQGFLNQYYQGSYGTDGVSTSLPYVITVPAGYYMVVDLSTIDLSSENDVNEAYSARMLFVASDVDQIVKSSVPTLTKEVLRKQEDGSYKAGDDPVNGSYDTDVAGVGDEVKFRLTGTLPSNYDNYLGRYQYSFIDTLDEGLAFVEETPSNVDVNITVTGVIQKISDNKYYNISELKDEFPDGVVITKDSYDKAPTHEIHITSSAFDVKKSKSGTKEVLTVEFPCLKEIIITDKDGETYRLGVNSIATNGAEGTSIINVEYNVKVTEAAKVGTTGNKNSAQIKYSNNPQASDDTNYTETEQSTVYTFGIDILKDDAASFIKDDPEALDNVQFVLLRPATDKTVGKYDIAIFNSDGEIKEWRINAIESDPDKSLRDVINEWHNSNGVDIYLQTSAGGKLNIKGLDDGVVYTLVETKTSTTEYAYIDPFTFTLSAEITGDEYTGRIESNELDDHEIKTDESASQKKFVINTTKSATDGNDGTASITVLNFKYTDLPSTGGIGVYIYYIAGGCVLALAALLFFLSKKKSNKKSA